MPKIILRSNFMKDAPAAHLSNYVKYIGTREGVEKIDESKALLPATVNQQKLVRQLTKDIGGTKNMLEYADYLANPTRENASEFISLALEQNLDLIGKRQNYVDYIANRPRVERVGEHGLFTDAGTPVVLAQVQDEVSRHKGAVWTHVVSLRREDAARLGYDSGKQWQDFIRSKKAMLCKNMKIPSENLRWFCAFHNESHHPHVHLMVYSTKDNEGFLTEKGIEAMRSELAHDIFRQDFANLYAEQNQSKAGLKEIAESAMQGLLLQMQTSICVNAAIEKDVLLLAQRLQNTAGKKQYGYLKADVKLIVDRIVDELAKQDTVAQAYAAWREIQNGILNTYQDKLPDSMPLSQQKELKSIKNMVIKEALNIGNGAMTFEPIGSEDEQADFASDELTPLGDTDPAPPIEDSRTHLDWSDAYKQARLCLFGDGDTPPDFEKAYDLFLCEADGGNALAMHDLGRMFANGLGRDVNADIAHQWYAKALAAFHRAEESEPKPYTEYRIGKLYHAGLGTEQDDEKAARWFAPAAEGGNKYAQYSLGGLYYKGNGVVQNYETAHTLYAESDQKNFPYASYELAKMHRDGVGTIKNTAKADECFQKAFVGFVALEAQSHDDKLTGREAAKAPVEPLRSRSGRACAMEANADKLQYRIGQMLLTGTGTEKDVGKASAYFAKSARLGNNYAQYQLAKIYLADETADLAKIQTAIVWLTKSAEGEKQFDGREAIEAPVEPQNQRVSLRSKARTNVSELAQYALAKLYRDGTHVEKSETEALRLFTLAAMQENEYAAFALGKLHLKSETLAKDVAIAVKWLSKSSDLGNQFAQYALGKLYLLGKDIPKDIDKAITLLTKSAEQENQYAQYTLGKLYLMGRDVAQDKAKALEYFTLSAAHKVNCPEGAREGGLGRGNEYAQFFIDHMDDFHEPSVLLCATRLMHHLSNIFEEQALPTVAPHGMQIDRKQRKKMQQKKAAQGHAQDDYAQEQTMG